MSVNLENEIKSLKEELSRIKEMLFCNKEKASGCMCKDKDDCAFQDLKCKICDDQGIIETPIKTHVPCPSCKGPVSKSSQLFESLRFQHWPHKNNCSARDGASCDCGALDQ